MDYTKSSGNVFADLGLRNPAGRLAKADLALEITRAIRQRGLSEGQAADLMALDAPKVTMITRGELGGFTLDRLVRCLYALGKDVRMVVVDTPPARELPHQET